MLITGVITTLRFHSRFSVSMGDMAICHQVTNSHYFCLAEHAGPVSPPRGMGQLKHGAETSI